MLKDPVDAVAESTITPLQYELVIANPDCCWARYIATLGSVKQITVDLVPAVRYQGTGKDIDKDVCLRGREIALWDPLTIEMYLHERHPSPDLYPLDATKRAAVRQLTAMILGWAEKPVNLAQHLLELHEILTTVTSRNSVTWLLGPKPYAVDLAAWAWLQDNYASHYLWTKRLRNYFDFLCTELPLFDTNLPQESALSYREAISLGL